MFWKKTISIVDSIVADRVVSDGIKTFFPRQMSNMTQIKTFWTKLTLDETRDITPLLET